MTEDHAFSPAFTRRSFLETVGAADALRRLDAGLGAREPFLVLTGEPGSGKTTLAHEAIARWESRVAAAFLAYPALTGAELLEEIVLRFGGQPADGASRPKLMACLERSLAEIAAQARVAMVVVDDAHKLSPELLEELRLLVNAAQQAGRPLEVLLAGLPALETLLDGPELAALRQRVSVRARLGALPAGETRRYLRHRVDAAGGDGATLFPRKTCNEIAALSEGLPRRINALASESLRLSRAAAEGAVQPEHVRAAAASLWGVLAAPVADARDDADDVEPRVAAAPRKEAAPVRDRARVETPRTDPAPARLHAMMDAQLADADLAPRPAPPTSHDPGEWVSRFIGDKGPVKIGSQAATHFAAARSPRDPLADASASPSAGLAVPPGAPAGSPSWPRRRRGSGLRIATYAGLATCGVIAAAILFTRATGPAGTRDARVTASTAPESAASPATPARAPRRVAVATSAAPVVAVKRDQHGGGASAAETPIASPTGRWTLEVGGALDLQTAFDERDRMEELVGIEGWVLPAPEGSSAPHRIVLGIYRSHERASAAAKMLLSSRTLRAVSVVPLPRRGERR